MGVEVDRAGRALVGPDLCIPGDPHVFVIGDAAVAVLLRSVAEGMRPQYVPGLAAAAKQMSEHTARTILESIRGEPGQAFEYRNRGILAVIGRGRELAECGTLKLTGPIAFFTWFFVHLLYLAGFRNHVSVLPEWAYAYFAFRPGARLLTAEDSGAEQRR
jgi:NADH dehydrogenase